MQLRRSIYAITLLATAAVLSSCGAGGNDPGLEYAPNMYHSVPYEPLTQITDKSAGEAAEWMDSNTDDTHGEYYNSNPYNPHEMNERIPPANTVRRTKSGLLPYRIHKDSLELAAKTVKNPYRTEVEVTDSASAVAPEDDAKIKAMIADGKILYGRYCQHCHGKNGEGDGSVASPPADNPDGTPPFAGVANLQGAAYKNITEGHIFHVITHGKGLMGAHGSQVSPEDRWKIAMYVKELQK